MSVRFTSTRSLRSTVVLASALPALSWAGVANADGTPPPEAQALVAAPATGPAAPVAEDKLDGTTVTLSAGGMSATGNSRQLALTGTGIFETLFDSNGVGISVLGNYGRSGVAGQPVETTAQNVQGRLRYDRYLVDRLSLFLINTGRHDRFQGLDFRYNLDPGVKYLFVRNAASSLWGELGYDFQYDVRRNEARIVLDDTGAPVLDGAGDPVLLDKTETDHSARAFAGFNHAFNEAVTLSTGLEFLQSLVDTERSRLNFDVVFAAKVGSGLALGFGAGARFDNAPLPGKENLDTTTTVSLIYAFSDVLPPPPPPPPCPEAPPLEPAPAPPSSATVQAPAEPPPPAEPPSEPEVPAPSTPPAPLPDPAPATPTPGASPAPTSAPGPAAPVPAP